METCNAVRNMVYCSCLEEPTQQGVFFAQLNNKRICKSAQFAPAIADGSSRQRCPLPLWRARFVVIGGK